MLPIVEKMVCSLCLPLIWQTAIINRVTWPEVLCLYIWWSQHVKLVWLLVACFGCVDSLISGAGSPPALTSGKARQSESLWVAGSLGWGVDVFGLFGQEGLQWDKRRSMRGGVLGSPTQPHSCMRGSSNTQTRPLYTRYKPSAPHPLVGRPSIFQSENAGCFNNQLVVITLFLES